VKDSVILRMIASSSEKNETKEHANVGKVINIANSHIHLKMWSNIFYFFVNRS